MNTLSVITLALAGVFSTVPALADPKARAALKAIPDATIQADLQKALKELFDGKAAEARPVTDYSLCIRESEAACVRYVLFQTSTAEKSYDLVLEYSSDIVEGKARVSSAHDYREEGSGIDAGNLQLVKLALARIEKDYKGGAPIKSKPVGHPFSAKVLHIAGQSESFGSGEDTKWSGRSNHIVHFSESGDSRVVGFTFGISYLVRTKNVDDKIVKSDVRRLLKIDELLK